MKLRLLAQIHLMFDAFDPQRYIDHEGLADGTETVSNENQKLFYHRVGNPQSEDVLVVEFPDHPKWRM